MTITIDNPWHKEGGLAVDPDLKRVAESSLRYDPQPIVPTDCRPDAVLTLRGPRRAGKTVSLKLLVAKLIHQELFRPREILWGSFEGLRTLEQAEDFLKEAEAVFQPKILIIDEVTALIGWQRVIKKLKDEGLFRQACLILTGSSAHDLKKGAERMAGRRGEVARPDRVLLPMSFADFRSQLSEFGASSLQGEREALERFLTVGGFPFRVEAFLKSLRSGGEFDPQSGYQVFDDVLFYEFSRRRLDRSIAMEVIGRLSQIGAGATSYDGFARSLSLSKDTARRYLDALGDAFLLATFSSYDTGRGRVAPKKDRKFLWVDPALGELASWLNVGTSTPAATRIESVVGVELLRRYEVRLWEGLSAPRSVFTWKSAAGKEIDFLHVDAARKQRTPYEVKYQSEISDWDFQSMERAFGSGVLVTLNDERKRLKSLSMPADKFLLSNISGDPPAKPGDT